MSDAPTATAVSTLSLSLTEVADADRGRVVRAVQNHFKVRSATIVGNNLRVECDLSNVHPDRHQLSLEVLEDFVRQTIQNHTTAKVGTYYEVRRAKPRYTTTPHAHSVG